jgi:predicted regulator of Ras-like GTPase activity (Roadblock/LC7/MglB family)
MSTEKELEEVINKIEADMTGFIAASVVDLESGMTLSARSARSDFDLAVASAYNSELVKQKQKIMKALGLKTHLEDMLLTLGDQIHLIKIFPGGHTFLYLAADRSTTNLAIVRNSVNRHVASLS